MKNRVRTIELLEVRRLLAGDSGVLGSDLFSGDDGTVAIETASSVKSDVNLAVLQGELGSAFAWSPKAPVAAGDFIIAAGDKNVSVVDPTQPSRPIVDTIQFDKAVSRLAKLDEQHFLIATSETLDALPPRVETSVYLLEITDSGHLLVKDQIDTPASLSQLSVKDGAVVLNWEQVGNFTGESSLFGQPDLVVSDSRITWSRYYTQYMDYSGDLLEQAFAVDSIGGATGQYVGNGRYVSSANGVINVFSLADGINAEVSGGQIGNVAAIQAAKFSEQDSIYTVLAVTNDDEFGFSQILLTIDREGGVVDVSRLLTGDFMPFEAVLGTQAISYTHDSLKMLYSNGVTANTVVYPAPGSHDLIIASDTENGFETQRIALPFSRIGFRPAFVVSDDAIIAVRADISELQSSGFRSGLGTIQYSAFLLRRQANGEFSVVDRTSLSGVDFDAAAYVAPNTVTLRAQDSFLATGENAVMRVMGDHLAISYYSSTEFELTAFDSGRVLVANDGRVSFTPWETPSVTDEAILELTDLDISGDGHVSAADALIVINQLNLASHASITRDDLSSVFNADVNHDGRVTAVDALLIINHLNRTWVNSGLLASGDKQDDEKGVEESGEAVGSLF